MLLKLNLIIFIFFLLHLSIFISSCDYNNFTAKSEDSKQESLLHESKLGNGEEVIKWFNKDDETSILTFLCWRLAITATDNARDIFEKMKITFPEKGGFLKKLLKFGQM